jgi:dTDP-4-dehydrorhamnose reductase
VAADRPLRLLITGLGGTLGPVLAAAARARGHTVLPWHRQAPGFQPVLAFAQLQPTAVAHLGLCDAAASGQLARLAAAASVPFLFTSTAMVFDHRPDGPHRPGDHRTARDDYGLMKVASEDAIRAADAAASIVRLGWQIGPGATGNTMLTALHRWQAEQGEVAVSSAWTPACSFMDDTAAALLVLLDVPGTHHLDANADEAWTMTDIATALQAQPGCGHWRLRVHEDYRHDQRLIGGPALPPLSTRLAGLQRSE